MKYSEDKLREVISTSISFRQVLAKLGLKEAGGNYYTLHKYIKYYNIDTSHFTGKFWAKGQKLKPKRDIQSYLDNSHAIQSNKLRKRLLLDNIFEHKCVGCNGVSWLNQPIPLELDHINGNNQDNSLENLRLLCPNCHAFTPTYRGKNMKRRS